MPLHPQVKEFLDGMKEQNPPGWEELPPEEGRAVFASLVDFFGKTNPDVAVASRDNLRIYTPPTNSHDGSPLPALVYFHGGGWVLGDLDTHDALCRQLAVTAQCVVVSVDYSRSPEAKFPLPMDDCYAATTRVVQQAEQFNIDRNRVAVGGDSAGGQLAAAVALRARDENGPPICLQLLIYPVLSNRCDTASYSDFADGFGLTRTAMKWFWDQLLESDSDGDSPYASPLHCNNLTNLPRAHVITAEYDVLRDEGESYVQRLQSANVHATHRRYDGMIHGFTHLSSLFDDGNQSRTDLASVLRDAFALEQSDAR